MVPRSLVLVAAALAVNGAIACSTEQATTLATELQQLFSGSEVTSAPTSCITAFQADESDFETLLCSSECVDWLRSVLDDGACDSEELETALAEVSGYVTQCQARRLRFANARELEREPVEVKRHNIRGLREQNDAQMGNAKPRLSVKGLMDAILVLTLNNAL